MEQELTGTPNQQFFPLFDEPQPPVLAPLSRIAEFESEVDAINYSVDCAMRSRRGLTQMQLADEMKIARAVMSKLRQGQVSMPIGKLLRFVRKTGSYALPQFYNLRLGLVTKTIDQEKADQRRMKELEERLAATERKYRRVVGE